MIPLLSGINSTSAALQAERVRMDVVSQNIANANTSRAADGKPYRRQQVVFESELNRAMTSGPSAAAQSVKVARIETDNRPAKLIYEPGHPDANAQGMVAIPDINIHEEMVDLIASSRAFEANLAVIKNARTMALQTLAIGKR
ncbi:MAG: flagellar basal body rod protein FlgC [Limisphaerales bacterium]